MGYKIDSLPLSSYVKTNVEIPRFQRGNKWNNSQKFELAISIFKKYPLGSVIMCTEIKGQRILNYLIDGRQRLTTLKEIFDSPDLLYTWATKYISIKESDTVSTIENKFWNKVREWINFDKNEKSDDNDETEVVQEDDNSSAASEESVDASTDSSNNENLHKLLDIIVFCHQHKSGVNTGITSVFDFKKYIENKSKFEKRLNNVNTQRQSTTRGKINCGSLKQFIYDYKADCERSRIDYKDLENFVSFVDDEYGFVNERKKSEFKTQLCYKWAERQLFVFQIFEDIERIFDNSNIAKIAVENAYASDEQKIFNVINDGGTPLTAAEILSSKPAWNDLIENVDAEIVQKIKILYKDVLSNENAIVDGSYCKWDLPASLLLSLNNFDIFFPVTKYHNDYKKGKDDKQAKIITIGFKIASGIFQGRIKKDDLNVLSDNPSINASDFGEFRNKFNRMILTISNMPYFATIRKWKLSLSSLVGDAPTLYFLFCAYFMFEKFGEPQQHNSDRNSRMFAKDCFVLMDSIIYEYVNTIWRGSSDSLIESKIKTFKATFKTDEVINPISSDLWEKLINEIIDSGRIKTKDISFGLIKPIIMHYYCIKKINPSLSHEYTTEFDHIIPKDLFSEATEASRQKINKDNLYNIGLLPKIANATKNSKKLSEIASNESLTENVTLYEEIPSEDFSKYSNANQLNDLKEFRGKIIKKAFKENRINDWINN